MTQQFTASEVRRQAQTFGHGRVNDMLNAFADMLEAQEKAVPVAYAAGLEANMRGFLDVMAWSEGEFTIPLYTHQSPSDAERLAEALQPFANLLQPHHASMPDDRPIYGINKAEITAGDLRCANEALIAHSAQAQPPAARVQDVDVLAQEIRRIDGDHKMGAACLAEHIVQFLTAQENPNG